MFFKKIFPVLIFLFFSRSVSAQETGSLKIFCLSNRLPADFTDFHRRLFEKTALSTGLESGCIPLNDDLIKDGDLDILGLPDRYDLLLGSIPRSYNAEDQADYIKIYERTEVLVYDSGKIKKIKTPADLKNFSGVIAESAGYLAVNLQKEIGNTELRITRDHEIFDILGAHADFAVMPSDQAFYIKGLKPFLRIDCGLLSNYCRIVSCGWYASADGKLGKKLLPVLSPPEAFREYGKIWKQHFRGEWEEYRRLLLPAENMRRELLRKIIRHFMADDFKKAFQELCLVRQNTETSAEFDAFYEKIFMTVLAESKSRNQDPYYYLDLYLHSRPEPSGIRNLADQYSAFISEYTIRMKAQSRMQMEQRNYQAAYRSQRIITMLKPEAAEEKKVLTEITALLRLAGPVTESAVKTAAPAAVLTQTPGGQAPAAAESPVEIKKILELDTVKNIEKIIEEKLDENEKIQAEMPVVISGASAPLSAVLPAVRPVVPAGRSPEEIEGERFFTAGLSAFENKNWSNAHNFFNKAASMEYKTAETRQYLERIENIVAQAEQQRVETIKKEFEKYFNLAIEAYVKNELDSALSSISRALEIFSGNRMARRYFDLISDRIRLEGEKTINSRSPYYQYYIIRMQNGEELIRQGKYFYARTCFEEILSLFPYNEAAKEKLALCLFRMNPQELAGLIGEFLRKAEDLFAAQNLKAAQNSYEFILKLKADHAPSLARLEEIKTVLTPKKTGYDIKGGENAALKAYQNKNYEEALAIYKKILEHDPENYTAMVNSGRIENELHFRDQAGNTAAENSRRREAEKLYVKGNYYFRLQDYGRALQFWEQALQADDSYKKAMIDIRRVKRLMEGG
ncbi:MAG TPA: hypothetical protein DC049_17810 [Spirochaetia bacterium]|nr:hypothetical protein [Spirochaetia bacterium]